MKLVLKTLLGVFLRVGLVIGIALGIGYAVTALLMTTHHLEHGNLSTNAIGVAITLLALFDWTAVIFLWRSALRHPEGEELRARLSQFILNAIGATLLSIYAVAVVIHDATGAIILPVGTLFVITMAALLLFSAQSIAFVVRVMRP